ncbi:MAG: hypothetical protein WDZ49_15570 [Litorilinea sp.]
MKIDRFTWIVLAVVVIILIGAVVTVNLTDGEGLAVDTYLTADEPATPVYNAFVAFQNGDVQTARRQYTARVLEEDVQDRGFNPFIDRFSERTARRLRIIEVAYDENDPEHAYVTAAIDTYQSSGLFGTGSTWTRRIVLDVVREPADAETGTDAESDAESETGATGAEASPEAGQEVWKVDTAEFFY